MSVFQVKLNQGSQGALDTNPVTGVRSQPSVQRTMFVTGPNGKIREIADGTTFTDCNYWKRFAVPAVSVDDAFIEVVTDDGSVYSDIASENTYPVVQSLTVAGGSVYASNVVDIAGNTGNFAAFVQMTSAGTTGEDILVKLNGSSSAIFTLVAGTTQVFNSGDISITQIAMQPVSGFSSGSAVVEVIYSVTSVCNS
jgi:hypothetical protein